MSFAFMPVYTGDYLRDTRHLSMSEHGCYYLLLMFCWDTKGPLPLDEKKIAGICNARSGDEFEAMRRVLAEFFIRMDDGWYNKRMAEEVAKAEQISNKNREAGLKSAEARKLIREAIAQRSFNARSTAVQGALVPSPPLKHKNNTTAASPADIPGFDEFWAIYPKRAGGNPKRRAQKAYHARLAEGHGPEEMVEGARRYAAYVQGIKQEGTQYVKQAATFLGPDNHFLDAWELPQAAENPMYSRWGVM
jgi:uncharacterized protein YdaU (DUF1376 family)